MSFMDDKPGDKNLGKRELGISMGMSSQIEHLTQLVDNAIKLGTEIANEKDLAVVKADYQMLKLEIAEFVYATTIWASSSPEHPWEMYVNESKKEVPTYLMSKLFESDSEDEKMLSSE